MDLGAIISSGVELALNTTSSVLADVEVQSITVGAYDIASDTSPETIVTASMKTLVYNMTEDEKATLYPKSGEAGYDTRKVLLPTTRLNGIVPKLEDRVYVDGAEYEVKKVLTVPGNSVYILYLARSK